MAFSEGGVGWLPYLLELFAEHMYGCFITDHTGVALREEIGVERMMWECDYPHSDSYWPNSRKIVTEMFHDVPDQDVHRIVEQNARELFHFPR